MELPDEFAPLAEPLAGAVELIERCGQAGMIIGAIAVGLVARPRHTDDVDAIIWCPDPHLIPVLLELAQRLGFEPRRPDALEFAQAAQVVMLRHVRTGIDFDLSLAQLPFEREALARRLQTVAGEMTIPCATADDLIVMKLVAHRDQDLLDIHNLVKNVPRINRRRVMRWTRDFARLLDSPDLVAEIEGIMDRAKKSRRRQ